MERMAAPEHVTIEAELDTLDRDTAQRVTRLVFECSASLELALQAVQDANSGEECEPQQPRARRR